MQLATDLGSLPRLQKLVLSPNPCLPVSDGRAAVEPPPQEVFRDGYTKSPPPKHDDSSGSLRHQFLLLQLPSLTFLDGPVAAVEHSVAARRLRTAEGQAALQVALEESAAAAVVATEEEKARRAEAAAATGPRARVDSRRPAGVGGEGQWMVTLRRGRH